MQLICIADISGDVIGKGRLCILVLASVHWVVHAPRRCRKTRNLAVEKKHVSRAGLSRDLSRVNPVLRLSKDALQIISAESEGVLQKNWEGARTAGWVERSSRGFVKKMHASLDYELIFNK